MAHSRSRPPSSSPARPTASPVPRLAIIGRPNVGKSTLFNRISGKRLALVDDMPGLTRDRKEVPATLGHMDILLIDTAGLEEAENSSIEQRMREQTEMAIMEADFILFLTDARAGLTPADETFAALVRMSGKPVIVCANKAEGKAGESGYYEAFSLGMGEPVAISAEHGEGLGELYAELVTRLEEMGFGRPEPEASEHDRPDAGRDANSDEDGSDEDTGRPLRIAIVGRPNAGKSTLVNTMLGEDRMITGPEAGITRDAISVEWAWQGRRVRLFDTAGLRRKARVKKRAEQLSVGDALRAIRFAELVIVLLDADCPLEKQDLTIADLVVREGRALVIGINKWDLVTDKQATLKKIREDVDRLLPQVRGVPVIPLSALAGTGVNKLMTAVLDVYARWNLRFSTAKLNRWLERATERHTPPAVRGRRLRLRYITQPAARPPTFVVFCSVPEELPESYTRYLVNSLKEEFGLKGLPVRLHTRKGTNPYADKNRRK